jgi:hypothetical protein
VCPLIVLIEDEDILFIHADSPNLHGGATRQAFHMILG